MTSTEISTRTVCVFCGSSSGSSAIFESTARELGSLIAQSKWNLVYGGGTTGRAAVEQGGQVLGVIPEALIQRERDNEPPEKSVHGDTVVVKDMHTRKRQMAEKADAFIALPGGFGTMEELFEVITWNQLSIHSRPIVLVNVDGYYDELLSWIDHSIKAGFTKASHRKIFVCVRSAAQAVDAVREYKAPEGRLDLDWQI